MRTSISCDGSQPARRRLCRTGKVLTGRFWNDGPRATWWRSSAPIGIRWLSGNRWLSMGVVGHGRNPMAEWGISGANRESSAGRGIRRPSESLRQLQRIVGVERDSLAERESSATAANRRRSSGIVGTWCFGSERNPLAEWGIFSRGRGSSAPFGSRCLWWNRRLGAGLDGRAGIFGSRGGSRALFWSRCLRGNHRLGSESAVAAVSRRCRSKFVGSARAWAGIFDFVDFQREMALSRIGIFGLEHRLSTSGGKRRRLAQESSASTGNRRSPTGNDALIGGNLRPRALIVDLRREATLSRAGILGLERGSPIFNGRRRCPGQESLAWARVVDLQRETASFRAGIFGLGRASSISNGK